MSPASKSKSKDKKASKEPQKASPKSSGPATPGNGVLASAYDPLLGTFHGLETSPASSTSPLNTNGRFRNIDETDDHPGGLLAAAVEYDSVSNNGSWSGESEDHKEKSNIPPKHETIPGADSDKREKIRQKNERKHQRQKERRAQELHERCSGYLMSRKLEALAQQFVAMGFPHEQATMALILNEGKVEQSVIWLVEGGEEAEKHMDQNLAGSNLKIDISEELARIAEMETRYKCSKQEIERAVVACEGDLEKAAETLKVMKHDPPNAPKPEETGDPPTAGNGKLTIASSNSSSQTKLYPPTIQQKRDEKDFNYTKAAVSVVGSLETGRKNFQQPLKGIPPKSEWAKPQQTALPAEKRWPSTTSNSSASYSLASSLQVSTSPAKTETRYVVIGNEFKNLQPGTLREPVLMMQRPQSINKQGPTTSMSSSPPGPAASWYPTNGVAVMKSSGFLQQIPATRSVSPNNLSLNQTYHQRQYQQQQQQQKQYYPNSSQGDSPVTSRGNGHWSRTGALPTLAAPSSLGLFSGLGSTGSSGVSSPVDWSTGASLSHLDYTNIDWTLDRSLSPTISDGLWLGLPSFSRNNTCMYDSNSSGVSAPPNAKSTPIAGLQDGGVLAADSSAAGSREWTSPFEGKDLFGLSRRFVSSPSL